MLELTIANVLAAAILVHGIGHVGGYWMLGNVGLLPKFLGSNTGLLLGSLIWIIALVGFVGAGLAIFGVIASLAVWRILAAASAIISLAIIALFWPGGTWNVPAATVGNIVTLAAVAYAPLWV